MEDGEFAITLRLATKIQYLIVEHLIVEHRIYKTKKNENTKNTHIDYSHTHGCGAGAAKKLSALHYIPTLYVEKENPQALAPLAEKIKAQLPIGAEVRLMLLADCTMLEVRKWQLDENRKWEERMSQIFN